MNDKQPNKELEDWHDEVEERRQREEMAHARRMARKEARQEKKREWTDE